MIQLENRGAQEIAASASYKNIRYFEVKQVAYMKPLEELVRTSTKKTQRWNDPSDPDLLARFSSVCFLTARQITDFSMDDMVNKKLLQCVKIWKIFWYLIRLVLWFD